MFGFSLVSIDATKVAPLAVIAGAGVGAYFLYQYLQTKQAAPVADTSLSSGVDVNNLEQLALLQGVLGGSGGGAGITQPTYSGSNTGSASNTSAITGASTESGAGGSSSTPGPFQLAAPGPTGVGH